MQVSRTVSTLIGPAVEVRCPNPLTIRGTEQPCNRLALRVTLDMLPLLPENVALRCDKCDRDIPWERAILKPC